MENRSSSVNVEPARAPAPGEVSSRTRETEKSYISRAILFEKRTSRNLSIDHPGPLEVAAFALECREEWSKSTWRQNKAALIFRYTGIGTTEALESVEILRHGSQSSCASKTGRTSAKRSKSVTNKAMKEVIKHLHGSKSKYASLLESWLLLGTEIGLRPHEWGQASVIQVSPLDIGDIDTPVDIGVLGDVALVSYLRIKNAKTTNGRGHGEFRHLNLSRLNPKLIEMIDEFSRLMSEIVVSNLYTLYYSSCRKLLWRINKVIHGHSSNKWIQLYSPRHKFSSEAKKALSSVGVAALLGHATTKTASEHYGRRNSAAGSLGPRPIESEVVRIRKIRGYKVRSSISPNIPSVAVDAN